MLELPTATLATRPRRMTGEERRRQLVGAAEMIFLQKGYHATTMDDIAREAGMSKKTVYQVCPTKLALFDAVLADRFSPFSVPIESDGRAPREVLTSALRRVVGLVTEARQVSLMRLLIAETVQSDDIPRAVSRQLFGPGKNALQEWLDEQTQAGALTVADPEQMAGTLVFAAVGDFLFGLLLRTCRAPTKSEVEAQVARAVEMFFRTCG